MKVNLSWKEKYRLSLQEEFTLKDIMKLRDCGASRASSIRKQAVTYSLKNNLYIGSQKVPAEAVFAITGCGIDYYYDRMLQEHKMIVLELQGV